MTRAIGWTFREADGWPLALKLAALLSFCGGPLVVAEWLRANVDGRVGFAVGFFPSGAMIFGVYSLKTPWPDRWDDWMVSLGRVGAVALVGMNAIGVGELIREPGRADANLIKLGIVVGTLFAAYYARAGPRHSSPKRRRSV